MSVLAVRAVFLLVIAWYLACLIPAERGKAEPYPSLLMPAFHGAPIDGDGRVVWMAAQFHVEFDDGSTEVVPDRQMLREIPQSQHGPLMRWAFLNTPPRPPPRDDLRGRKPTTRWFRTHVVPGYVLARQRRNFWDGIDPRTVQWLRQELARLFPGRSPVRVIVRHYHNSGGPGLEPERREIATLEIDL